MSDQIRVNGNIMSWGSIRVKAAGEIFYGFTSISYGDKRERVHVYGQGRHHGPRGRTAGKYSTDPGKLGGPTSTIAALRKRLAELATDRKSYGSVSFQVIVQYVEEGSSEEPLTVELDRTVLDANTASHSESADPTTEEVSINYMLIYRNGLTLFDQSQGVP
jgi:hypothetical protein